MKKMSEVDYLARIATEHNRSTLGKFGRSIGGLPISMADIKGDVLVIGHGCDFPERLLVCSPQSRFTQPRRGINSVTCCDREFFTNPKNLLDVPVNRIASHQQPPDLTKGRVNYYPHSLQTIADGGAVPDSTFETVTAFRLSSLQEQIKISGFLDIVARALRPDGVFIGSGSFDDMETARKLVTDSGLEIEELERLAPVDASGYPFITHVGIIARKKR